jgi:hypothetical protein
VDDTKVESNNYVKEEDEEKFIFIDRKIMAP